MHNYPILALDFETFYGPQFSLTSLTTKEYVLDPRFKVHGVGVRWLHEPASKTRWISGHDAVKAFFATIDWSATAVLCQNANFDAFILMHVYGISPAFIHDTAAMGRMYEPNNKCGLEHMARRYLGLEKGTDLIRTYGLTDLPADVEKALAGYCIKDVDLMVGIYWYLLPYIPFPQQQLIDIAVRLHTEPKFVLDVDRVTAFRDVEQASAAEKVKASGLPKTTLSSNPKFAAHLESLGIEVPMKMGKNGPIPALAKNDLQFQDLQNDYPEYNDLWEARIAAKSRINETRAQRFLDARMPDGTIPMPLKVAGAHTFRFSGFDSMNVQNMPRGGELRKSLTAPPGYVVCVIDKSQIEARTNAWLAGQDDLLNVFRTGGDPYKYTGERIFKESIDLETERGKNLRFLGKTCLALGTRVLTNTGIKPIEQVLITDKLWDGKQWVGHSGLMWNGLKPVINTSGVWSTPDHRVFTGERWADMQHCRSERSVLSQALAHAAANLPSRGTLSLKQVKGLKPSLWRAIVARCRNIISWLVISGHSNQRVAASAQKKLATQNATGSMRKHYQTTPTVPACSTGCPLPLVAAITPQTSCTNTMGSVELKSALNGEMTAQRFLSTLRQFRAGIIQAWTWIAMTITEGTNRETYGLRQNPKTQPTSALSKISKLVSENLKKKMHVFDLANSGPNNRFTIITDEGPLIVHNCTLGLGYNMGWEKFARVLRSGAMGPKYDISDEDAKMIVSTWRQENFMIVRLWEFGKQALFRMMDRKANAPLVRGPIEITRERIRLPSGLSLHYPGLKYEEGQFSYWDGKGKYWKKIFGGKLIENIIQALANCIIVEAILRVQPYLKEINGWFALQVHDELVFLVPEVDAEKHAAELARLMVINPDWCPDLPIAVGKPGIAKEYSK